MNSVQIIFMHPKLCVFYFARVAVPSIFSLLEKPLKIWVYLKIGLKLASSDVWIYMNSICVLCYIGSSDEFRFFSTASKLEYLTFKLSFFLKIGGLNQLQNIMVETIKIARCTDTHIIIKLIVLNLHDNILVLYRISLKFWQIFVDAPRVTWSESDQCR